MTTGLCIPSPPSQVSRPHALARDAIVFRDVIADEGLTTFLRLRPRLFGIACRMLRSAAEAEEIVQDVWVRWQTTDRSVVRDPAAFLATTATRLAINVMQSARSRRETHVDSSLPEPVNTSADPALRAERAEALNFALLLLLETLSPTERTAYVLREAFNYPYREIADILQIEEANARQLLTRARQHVSDGRRAPVGLVHRRLLRGFIAAARSGDLGRLETLFVSDIVSAQDNGGFVRAARLPVVVRERVAKFIASVAEHLVDRRRTRLASPSTLSQVRASLGHRLGHARQL